MSRGHFVVLVGPDGVGKTTLAQHLILDHGEPSLYVHFRPGVWRRPPSVPGLDSAPPHKRTRPGPKILGWLRLARSIPLFWLGYIRWIRPAVKGGALVVGDRWAYGYVGQPQALGFGGPSWLARLAARIVPRPDLIVRLSAPVETIAGRKADLTAQQIESEAGLWKTLPIRTWELDASKEPSQMVEEVAARLVNGRR